MLLAAGVVSFSFSSSSAGDRMPSERERVRRVKRTSVGMAGREDVSVKTLELGLRKVARRKRKDVKKRTLREIWAEDGSGRGGGA